MIIGMGIDMCDIRRIEKSLARFGERFEQRIFTQGERERAKSRADSAGTYAKRFAAKEACAKALGTGLGKVAWQDIEVVNAENGAPTILLSGNALRRLADLTPRGMSARIFLSLADEYPIAQAQVIIEAVAP